jgi:hypothetical protein
MKDLRARSPLTIRKDQSRTTKGKTDALFRRDLIHHRLPIVRRPSGIRQDSHCDTVAPEHVCYGFSLFTCKEARLEQAQKLYNRARRRIGRPDRNWSLRSHRSGGSLVWSYCRALVGRLPAEVKRGDFGRQAFLWLSRRRQGRMLHRGRFDILWPTACRRLLTWRNRRCSSMRMCLLGCSFVGSRRKAVLVIL